MKQRFKKAICLLMVGIYVALYLIDAYYLVNSGLLLLRGIFLSGPIMLPLWFFVGSVFLSLGLYVAYPITKTAFNGLKD